MTARPRVHRGKLVVVKRKGLSVAGKEIGEWHNRLLGEFRYVILDASYEKLRHGGIVVDDKRTVLGISMALSEAEVHWPRFLGASPVRLGSDRPGIDV